jgi:branched-chain amino acid transport system ATP-binding protein
VTQTTLPESDPRAPAAGVLSANGIRVEFDGIKALDGIDLTLTQGETLGLIGPNGAGKSTLVNVLTGFQTPTAGEVRLDDRDITRLPAHRRVRVGIVRTFQSTRVFTRLSVAENVEMGALNVERSRRAARAWTKTLLQRAGLWERADESAAVLSTGDAQRLGVARSLASRPRFLLLDEPAAGLNDRESDELVSLLREVASSNFVGVLIIEHNLGIVAALSSRIQVIDEGCTIGVGTPEEIQLMPAVLSAYLGQQRASHVAS